MSSTEPRPKVPNTMSYTDEERELARSVQQRNKPGFFERNKKKIVGGVAVNALLLTGALVGVKTLFTDKIEESLSNPGVSAPEVPGGEDTDPGTSNELEAKGGVQLSAAQLEAFNSGDLEAQAGVINKTIMDPLSERMDAYTSGASDSFDISDLVSDTQVQDDILNIVKNHWSADFDELREQGLQGIGFCDANVPNPDATTGPCEGRNSILKLGEPAILDGYRVTYDPSTFMEVPEDMDNLANTRPEFTADTITLSLNGDMLSLTSR
jgi:hypothetical protein